LRGRPAPATMRPLLRVEVAAWLVILLLVMGKPATSVSHYELLNVGRDATSHEIKKAYRRMALELHPDKLAPFESEEAEKAASTVFSQLAQAYEVLSDPTKRRQYDLTGETDDQRREKTPEFGRTYEEHPYGLFVRFRGGSFKLHYRGTGVKGMPPTNIPVHVSLEELLKPVLFNTTVNRQVICPACQGTGASSPENFRECPYCEGTGMGYHLHEEPACASCSASSGSSSGAHVTNGKRGWRGFRQASHSWCKVCGGAGRISDHSCPRCSGQKTVVEQVEMSIWIPAGAPDGTQVVQNEQGNQHPFRKRGDLIFTVHSEPHPRFRREGADIHYAAKMTLIEALTGMKKKLTLLSGKRLTVKHSKVTFSGYQKRFPGHGLPVTEEGQDPKAMPRTFGDLVVDFEVVFPQRLTPKQYTVLAKVLGPERTELLSKLLKVMTDQLVVPLSDEEALYCDQSWYDVSGSPEWCMPHGRWWETGAASEPGGAGAEAAAGAS